MAILTFQTQQKQRLQATLQVLGEYELMVQLLFLLSYVEKLQTTSNLQFFL